MNRVRSLAQLKVLARELAQRKGQATAAAERNASQPPPEPDLDDFAQAAGPVTPLQAPPRVLQSQRPRPPTWPVQRRLDEERVLNESLSDAFDAATLLDVDDALSFSRPGIGADVLRKLRRGHWALQAEIDLHGLRRDEAREALAAFIRQATQRGLRCLRVVHGKGLGSPGRQPVLKGKVLSWLMQKDEVIAFVQARPADGGAGATLVLLKPLKPRATSPSTDA